MHLIPKKTLVRFYEKYPLAKQQLLAWAAFVEKAEWKKPSDVVESLPKTDVINSKRIIFNIKCNNYRLIADIEYRFQKVFIVWIGTHSQYNEINAKDVKYTKNNKD
jgi:mRNA interferase HigB